MMKASGEPFTCGQSLKLNDRNLKRSKSFRSHGEAIILEQLRRQKSPFGSYRSRQGRVPPLSHPCRSKQICRAKRHNRTTMRFDPLVSEAAIPAAPVPGAFLRKLFLAASTLGLLVRVSLWLTRVHRLNGVSAKSNLTRCSFT